MSDQSITLTFRINATTREAAVERFLTFWNAVAFLADREYGITAASVELVPTEEGK